MKPKPKFRPTPAGTLVVPGKGGSSAIYCDGDQLHVWRTGKAVRTDIRSHGSGYAQGAICAECGRVMDDNYDAAWWSHRRAGPLDLAEARKRLTLRIRELRERLRQLGGR